MFFCMLVYKCRTTCDNKQKGSENMNVNKLKGMLVAKGMNVEALADMIGTERSSMYRKLANFEKITIGEAKKIAIALEMSDEEAIDIFLK